MTYPTTPIWYVLVGCMALALLAAAGSLAFVQFRGWRDDRRDERAMSRAVGRMLRNAARGEDHRSWR